MRGTDLKSLLESFWERVLEEDKRHDANALQQDQIKAFKLQVGEEESMYLSKDRFMSESYCL